jgi:hypothetical protein
MESQEIKKLCLNLACSDTEEEVEKILISVGLWENNDVWQLFGNKENNYGEIGNQMSRADGAIVEKIINSVDAILMAECLKNKINPDGSQAPQSIRDAQIQFFNIEEGKLSNLTARERTRLAENIMVVATGSKINPTYSIIDRGEGQTPIKMPSTLLSLGESNKLKIPFVQGKFNMGGTGVFRFCGKQNLQLILSKRNPEIAKNENDPSKNNWGFTVIRRENPNKQVRSSTYKYLAPEGKILSFEADSLPLIPADYPIAYEKPLEWGTYIKLFEYQISGGLGTIITLNFLYRLSLLLPQVALPIRLYERRKNYSANSYETTLSGLDVRLEEDKSKNLEDNFPTTGSMNIRGQKIKYSIFVFKKGKSETYMKGEGIIFVINGQTHGHLSQAFFNRNKVGLGYLADSILVILDCTDFDGRAREDLFKNDRETLISCDLRFEIEKELEDLLKNHQGLKELKERRKREEIEKKLEDSKPLKEVLDKILEKSPTLSKFFIKGLALSNPFNLTNVESQKKFQGKFFPTFFSLIHKYPQESPKIAHLKSKFRVQYKTDVVNDYFDRSKDGGIFKLYLNNEEISNYSLNLWKGTATLNLSVDNYSINQILKFKSIVLDNNKLAQPFTEEFYVKVEKEQVISTGNGSRILPPSNKEGKKSVNKDRLALPDIIPIRKQEWEKYSFDKESALKVICNGENDYDFLINLDNIHLLTELKYSYKDEIKLLEARYQYGMVLIGLALLNENENVDEDAYSKIFDISKKLSPILLPMIGSLGALELEEMQLVSTG